MTNVPHFPLRAAGLVVAALALSGCAASGNPDDPFESYNRTMFRFNETVDRVALKPAATVYQNAVPSFVQTGVGNFFGNIADVWTMVNSFLQGKVHQGLDGFMRVAVNTTFGLGGVLDFSSPAGLDKHDEDFGQTLGYWGVGAGPYVVLPLFGPSTLRDTVGLPVDVAGNLWTYKQPNGWRNVGTAVHTLDERAALLNAGSLLNDVALDKYQFVRDAYLQRRESQVHDGASSRDDAPASQAK